VIDRSDISGVTIAVVAHVALFGLLSLGFLASQAPVVPQSVPIQVTLTDEVALVSGAPDPSPEAPAARKSPVEAPIVPEPAAAPVSEPKPPAKPQPAPPKSALPDPHARQRPDRPSPNQATTSRNARTNVTPTGRLDGLDLNGPSDRPSNSTSTKQQASTMTAAAAQNINSLIKRAVQPCADRQVIPAAEARQIVAIIQLQLKRDGSLASVQIVGHEGVNDANQRYVARVDDAVEAIFAGCTPIRGLPTELYDIPQGWKSRKFRYRLNS